MLRCIDRRTDNDVSTDHPAFKIKEDRSFVMSVTVYHQTQYNTPEELHLHQQRCDKLKIHK